MNMWRGGAYRILRMWTLFPVFWILAALCCGFSKLYFPFLSQEHLNSCCILGSFCVPIIALSMCTLCSTKFNLPPNLMKQQYQAHPSSMEKYSIYLLHTQKPPLASAQVLYLYLSQILERKNTFFFLLRRTHIENFHQYYPFYL